MSRIVPAGSDEIRRAAEILRGGGLVAFPTETVYGLGAHALDERAVARIFEAKGRPRFDPLIVHVANLAALYRLVAEFPPVAGQLADRFWPGPLTLVLPKSDVVPDIVTAGRETIAVRVPDHPAALALLGIADVPVAAPSANAFGRISPTTAQHVGEQLAGQVDLILDGGPCRVGVESTVLQLSDGRATLLRPGGASLEDIEALIGPVEQLTAPEPESAAAGLASPGMLARHYAPRTPLTVRCSDASADLKSELAGERCGLLAFRPPADTTGFVAIEVLSPAGDLREAAAGFFAALRRLDGAGLDRIIADPFPEQGLGRALNDRLRRAAHD